jgi:hypothetical protein
MLCPLLVSCVCVRVCLKDETPLTVHPGDEHAAGTRALASPRGENGASLTLSQRIQIESQMWVNAAAGLQRQNDQLEKALVDAAVEKERLRQIISKKDNELAVNEEKMRNITLIEKSLADSQTHNASLQQQLAQTKLELAQANERTQIVESDAKTHAEIMNQQIAAMQALTEKQKRNHATEIDRNTRQVRTALGVLLLFFLVRARALSLSVSQSVSLSQSVCPVSVYLSVSVCLRACGRHITLRFLLPRRFTTWCLKITA